MRSVTSLGGLARAPLFQNRPEGLFCKTFGPLGLELPLFFLIRVGFCVAILVFLPRSALLRRKSSKFGFWGVSSLRASYQFLLINQHLTLFIEKMCYSCKKALATSECYA